MTNFKIIIPLLIVAGLLFLSAPTYAQSSGFTEMKDSIKKTTEELLNQIDQNGNRQGIWYQHHKNGPVENEVIIFGMYLDNQKEGLWYKMDKLGKLISIENYMKGLLNGTTQYYEQGNLACIGNYRGLYSKFSTDSFWVTNPLTGYDTLVIVPTEKGSVKQGTWRFYNTRTGQLYREELYQADKLIYQRDFKPDPAVDSLYRIQRPQYLPIDKKRATHKIPSKAKKKIGY